MRNKRVKAIRRVYNEVRGLYPLPLNERQFRSEVGPRVSIGNAASGLVREFLKGLTS